jgi:imidazolonepropionase-like amidohydrolase
MERVNAGLLIPGHGEPVRDATVLIDGGRISYAGPAAGAPATPGAATQSAATVLPGCGTATVT